MPSFMNHATVPHVNHPAHSAVCMCSHTPEYSLDPKGHQRDPNHQHVQQIEVVPAEGSFVEESSKSCHLQAESWVNLLLFLSRGKETWALYKTLRKVCLY